MKNLKTFSFTERFILNSQTSDLLNHAKGDSYALSMPMLIFAMMGNMRDYWVVREMVQIGLDLKDASHELPFRAWMLGRMVLADKFIEGDLGQDREDLEKKKTIEATLTELKTCLQSAPAHDPRTVWAWGYLACADYSDANKTKMLQVAQDYSQSKDAKVDCALWAWVLCLQAAAIHHDIETYKLAILQITKMAEAKTVPGAIKKGLPRDKNDFPGWAGATVMWCAQKMGDKVQYEWMQPYVEECLKETKAFVEPTKNQPTESERVGIAEHHLTQALKQLTRQEALTTPAVSQTGVAQQNPFKKN